MLCQNSIAQYLPSKETSYDLVLPTKMKVAVAESFDPVIQVGKRGRKGGREGGREGGKDRRMNGQTDGQMVDG